MTQTRTQALPQVTRVLPRLLSTNPVPGTHRRADPHSPCGQEARGLEEPADRQRVTSVLRLRIGAGGSESVPGPGPHGPAVSGRVADDTGSARQALPGRRLEPCLTATKQ